jgi:hypothetical protein
MSDLIMTESEEITEILAITTGFWETEGYRSPGPVCEQGGIWVGITETYQWIVTWRDGSYTKSDRAFPSAQDAKCDLRRFLIETRTTLDTAKPPSTQT